MRTLCGKLLGTSKGKDESAWEGVTSCTVYAMMDDNLIISH